MITISKTIKRAVCAVLATALLVTGVVMPKKVEAAGADGVWIDGFAGLISGIKLETKAYNLIGYATENNGINRIEVKVVRSGDSSVVQSGVWPATNDETKLKNKGTKVVNMKDTYINKKCILFGKLGAGSYRLVIDVYDKKNNHHRKVISFEMAYNVKSYVNNLYYGLLGRAADDG